MSANRATILLVDDEPDILLTFKMGLERYGYSVDAYSDPAKALDNYQPNYYDRICLDIRMAGMNGFELARAIWQKDPGARVCFMTAFEIHEEEAMKAFKNLNPRCFLKKPMTPKALVEHIEKHLFKASFLI